MRKRFVAPVLREEATLARITLQFQITSTGCDPFACTDGV